MRRELVSVSMAGVLALLALPAIAHHVPGHLGPDPAPATHTPPADNSPRSASFAPPSSQRDAYMPPNQQQTVGPRAARVDQLGPSSLTRTVPTAAEQESVRLQREQAQAALDKSRKQLDALARDRGYESKLETARQMLEEKYEPLRAALDKQSARIRETMFDKEAIAAYAQNRAELQKLNAWREEQLVRIRAQEEKWRQQWEQERAKADAAFADASAKIAALEAQAAEQAKRDLAESRARYEQFERSLAPGGAEWARINRPKISAEIEKLDREMESLREDDARGAEGNRLHERLTVLREALRAMDAREGKSGAGQASDLTLFMQSMPR